MREAERDRLAGLRSCRSFDTGPGRAFDDPALLESGIGDVPIALVAPVESGRESVGPRVGVCATRPSGDVVSCADAIPQRGLIIVPEAMEDARVPDSPDLRVRKLEALSGG